MFAEIMAGGSLLSGLMGADAASDAAAGQTAASNAAIAEQRRQYDLARKDQSPFLQTGTAANIKLRDLLGLGGASNRSMEQIAADLRSSGRYRVPGQKMQQGTPILGEGGIAGYSYGSDGRQYSEPMRMVGADTIDEAGLSAEAQRLFAEQSQAGSDPSSGELMRNFTGENLTQEPGYEFRLSEGNKAIENAARARGVSMSPMTVKELLRYGQDYASGEYQNAYNRDMANKTTKYNFLTGTSGGGQQAANTVGNAGMNMANNVGGLVTGAANARGAAGIAGANALSGGFTNAANMWNQQNILNQIMNRGGVAGSSVPGYFGTTFGGT